MRMMLISLIIWVLPSLVLFTLSLQARRSKGTVDHLGSVSKPRPPAIRYVGLSQVYDSSELFGDEIEPTSRDDASRQTCDQI
jgi:hypothetical protein